MNKTEAIKLVVNNLAGLISHTLLLGNTMMEEYCHPTDQSDYSILSILA